MKSLMQDLTTSYVQSVSSNNSRTNNFLTNISKLSSNKHAVVKDVFSTLNTSTSNSIKEFNVHNELSNSQYTSSVQVIYV